MGDASSFPAESPSVSLPTSRASSAMPAPRHDSSQREGSVVSYATEPDNEDARSDRTERAERPPIIPLTTYYSVADLRREFDWGVSDALAAAQGNLLRVAHLLSTDTDALSTWVADENDIDVDSGREVGDGYKLVEAWAILSCAIAKIVTLQHVERAEQIFKGPMGETLIDFAKMFAHFRKELDAGIKATQQQSSSFLGLINRRAKEEHDFKASVDTLTARQAGFDTLVSKVGQNTIDIKEQLRKVMSELGKIQASIGAPTSYAGKAGAASAASPTGAANTGKSGNKRAAETGPTDPADKGKGKAVEPAAKKARGDDVGTSGFELQTKEDWSRLRGAATVGEFAPTIQLSEAAAIAAGLLAMGSGLAPFMFAPSAGASAPADAKQITSGQDLKDAKEQRPKRPLPKTGHVNYAGPAVVKARSMMVRTTTPFASAMEPVTEDELKAAAQRGLVGTVVVCQNCAIRGTGCDAQLLFSARPSTEEAGKIHEEVTSFLSSRLPNAVISCTHAETLTCIGIQAFKGHHGSDIKDLYTPFQVWAELKKAAATHPPTKTLVENVLPCTSYPTGRYEGAKGSGRWLLYVKDTHSGSVLQRLIKGRKILFEGKEHALQYVQPNNAIYPCSQCWRWTHQGNCKLRGNCCSRCGAMHGDDYHPISCFSCKVIKASGGTPPEVCPPEHCWCPNCKVYGHGPNDKPQCRFWKKNRNAEWIKKHAEGSEDPYQQKERELKELRKVKQATAKTAEAVKAMAQANDAVFLEEIQDGINDITASGQFVQGSSNEPTVHSCLI